MYLQTESGKQSTWLNIHIIYIYNNTKDYFIPVFDILDFIGSF